MNTENSKIYSEEFKVHTYEVDPLGRLTMDSLCQFVQEAASSHADKLGFGVKYLLGNKRTWILSRLAVETDRPVKLGETLKIITWPSGSEKLFYIRDFIIQTASDGEIGRGQSYWLFIDTEKRRPIPPSKGEIVFDYTDQPEGFKRKIAKIPPADGKGSRIKSFDVRFGDLDLNNHVNNIAYVRWAMEGIDTDFRKSHAPVSIEINFLSEALYGHTVSLEIAESSENEINHYLYNNETELCRIKTLWFKT